MAKERRNYALVRVNLEDLQNLFGRKEISDCYEEMKKKTEGYYQKMIKQVKENCESQIALMLLEDKEVEKSNDVIIQTVLFNKALENLVSIGSGDFEKAVIDAITEENFIYGIDELKEITEETINEFCFNLIGGVSNVIISVVDSEDYE